MMNRNVYLSVTLSLPVIEAHEKLPIGAPQKPNPDLAWTALSSDNSNNFVMHGAPPHLKQLLHQTP